MTSSDFEIWIAHMGWSQRRVAKELDLSRNTVARYLIDGAPRHIGLACAALAHGLTEWRTPE